MGKGGSAPKVQPPPPPTPQTVNDMAGDALEKERERQRMKFGRSSTIIAGTLGSSNNQTNRKTVLG